MAFIEPQNSGPSDCARNSHVLFNTIRRGFVPFAQRNNSQR